MLIYSKFLTYFSDCTIAPNYLNQLLFTFSDFSFLICDIPSILISKLSDKSI